MTKLKKVVAIMLALLMMFSSASVLATAWDATTDDGSALTIATKFFKEVDGEWVETTKVRPNDTVKARVYLGTDYYSNDSTLLFFYDSDFFTLSSTGALAVNSSSFVTANGITANYKTNSNVNSQVAAGYIDSAFLGEYSAVTANVYTEAGDNDGNVMYDNSDWLLEFTMTVKADASGEGDFFVKDTTVQNTTTQSKGIVNVPKGPADGTHMDIWAMWLWDANVSLSSQPVTTISSVTFNANGGKYDDGTDSKLVEGEIDSAIAEADVPTPSLEGYTFMGWVDAADADPTLDEAAPAPTNIPENDLVLNAFWLKNVNITFNTDGGSEIAPIENVTPYTDFADVAAPTKAGYTFVGWDVRGEGLPETYPDVDTTYTAIWALNVVVSFDTLGGTEIADVPGYEGDEFKATIPNPVKEGHRFVKWDNPLPTVFPEADTTYTAVYETLTYILTYVVNGEYSYEIELEYGAEIPTSLILAELPDGTEIKQWYTDAACSNALADGATMGAANATIYAKTENKTYNATFMVDGEEYKVVPTVYGDFIAAPADPAKLGYDFAGWDNEVGTMPAKNVVFNATWVESNVNVVYYLDGTGAKWETFTIAYGDVLDVPADPYKEGWEFLGWAETVDGEVVELPEKMPATSLKFYAIFKQSVAELVINEYEESAHGPAATPAPALVPMADYSGMVQIGTTVTLPSAEEMAIENYIFTGWVDGEGNVYAADAEIIMPAAGLELIPTYDRVTVKLVPAEGSTVVIERTLDTAGRTVVKESYNDNSVTTDIYTPASEACFEQYYIYGLKTGLRDTTMKVDDAAGTVSAYIDIQGDGYTVVTPITRGRLGTGTLVEVYDYVTGELAERFYVVIFGDIDGNSIINSVDSGLVSEEIMTPVWSGRNNRTYYLFKAANLDGNRVLNSVDSGYHDQAVTGEVTIDQTTGLTA